MKSTTDIVDYVILTSDKGRIYEQEVIYIFSTFLKRLFL